MSSACVDTRACMLLVAMVGRIWLSTGLRAQDDGLSLGMYMWREGVSSEGRTEREKKRENNCTICLSCLKR